MSKKFDTYLTQEEAEDGLKWGRFASGVLRVNPKRVMDGFCVTQVSDILIKGKHDRNRAFNGDSIVVEIFPEEDWHRPTDEDDLGPDHTRIGGGLDIVLEDQDKSPIRGLILSVPIVAEASNLAAIVPPPGVVKTGRVVYISKAIWEGRTYVCSLHPNYRPADSDVPAGYINNEDKVIKAVPVDKRIPWILIQVNDFVRRALKLPGHLDPNVVYPIQVLKWGEGGPLPLGRLKGVAYGRVGEPVVEAKVCLSEAGLQAHEDDFPSAVNEEVERLNENFLRDVELEAKRRIDLRQKRIFTIDPFSARDLDDAIHIDVINDDFVEIGVHIADVAHYVQEGSEVDKIAKERCTSVYMCHRVYPMLPEGLSNSLCSLTADEPKLTFSSWYRIRRSTGEVILDAGHPHGPRFAKTLIQSCCRFTYEEVQNVLDGVEIPLTDRPPVSGKTHTWEDLSADLFLLFDVCTKVRNRRFAHGSVRIDKTKMRFDLNDRDVPTGYSFESHSASHWMIEELMLLSNEVVAKRISALGESAVLRRHPEPDKRGFTELSEKVKTKLGLAEWDGSTSGKLFASLQLAHTKLGSRVASIIEFMVMKTMRPAEYVTQGVGDFRHYALAFDFYTHFTSPIRRYPDILVHRQLQTVLELSACGIDPKTTPSVAPTPEELAALNAQCELCNVMKRKARLAQEACDVAFFCIYLRSKKHCNLTTGTVISVSEKCFKVYVPKLNADHPVYFSFTGKIPDWYLEGTPERAELDHIIKGPESITYVSADEAVVVWDSDTKINVLVFDPIEVVIVPLDTVPISFALLLLPATHKQFGQVALVEADEEHE